MDFESDSPRSLLWNISAFVAFVCFCSRNYGLTGGARTGTEFEQKVAKVTKGGAEGDNGGRLMRAGGAFEIGALTSLAGRNCPIHVADQLEVGDISFLGATGDLVEPAYRGRLQTWFGWISGGINDVDLNLDGISTATHPALTFFPSFLHLCYSAR